MNWHLLCIRLRAQMKNTDITLHSYHRFQLINVLFVVSQLQKRCRRFPCFSLFGFCSRSSGNGFLFILATLASCSLALSSLSFSSSQRADSGINLERKNNNLVVKVFACHRTFLHSEISVETALGSGSHTNTLNFYLF